MDTPVYIIVVIIIALIVGVNIYVNQTTVTTVTDTVLGKEGITSHDSDGKSVSKYVVYGDKETYQCTDDILHLKFDSSDVYGHLIQNHSYRLTVNGFRVPFISMYRNIIKAEPV